jgi:translation initiation factor 2 alpha subunit (eIF-2alpha)
MKAPSVNFYSHDPPSIGDVVVVEAMHIEDYGVTCSLLEYPLLNGTINFSEVSRTRQRNIKRLLKIGKTYVATITNVADGFVDLSRKRVTSNDDIEAWYRFKKRKSELSMLWSASEYNEDVYKQNLDIVYCGDAAVDVYEAVKTKYNNLVNKTKKSTKKYSTMFDVK